MVDKTTRDPTNDGNRKLEIDSKLGGRGEHKESWNGVQTFCLLWYTLQPLRSDLKSTLWLLRLGARVLFDELTAKEALLSSFHFPPPRNLPNLKLEINGTFAAARANHRERRGYFFPRGQLKD
ncbi:hypothetical protein HPP92_024431 [Vanilla planifolia]|uniref:Uncharacterized protein n=1 Tax=Vanilla planifolia TaxID=51239 RepID=A0A835PPQ2_VANPL|nr:hypothetical protein HPP92_024431 [Vanilla planifolia]